MTMVSELQRIVDSLGQRLQRAVAIDNPRMRLQAYSPHYGEVDQIRLESILQREAPREAVDWVIGLGIAKAPGPVRVAANPELGTLPRVCVPIRYQHTTLGFLWLIDADESLTDDDLRLAVEAAENAGVVMYREQLVRELERSREREHLRDLLAPDAGVRAHAASELVDADLVVPGTRVVALVVWPVQSAGEAPDEGVRLAIDSALSRARRWRGS
jgi:GAF domain-containing protein